VQPGPQGVAAAAAARSGDGSCSHRLQQQQQLDLSPPGQLPPAAPSRASRPAATRSLIAAPRRPCAADKAHATHASALRCRRRCPPGTPRPALLGLHSLRAPGAARRGVWICGRRCQSIKLPAAGSARRWWRQRCHNLTRLIPRPSTWARTQSACGAVGEADIQVVLVVCHRQHPAGTGTCDASTSGCPRLVSPTPKHDPGPPLPLDILDCASPPAAADTAPMGSSDTPQAGMATPFATAQLRTTRAMGSACELVLPLPLSIATTSRSCSLGALPAGRQQQAGRRGGGSASAASSCALGHPAPCPPPACSGSPAAGCHELPGAHLPPPSAAPPHTLRACPASTLAPGPAAPAHRTPWRTSRTGPACRRDRGMVMADHQHCSRSQLGTAPFCVAAAAPPHL
jgi:hypothetical protein